MSRQSSGRSLPSGFDSFNIEAERVDSGETVDLPSLYLRTRRLSHSHLSCCASSFESVVYWNKCLTIALRPLPTEAISSQLLNGRNES